jgi:hypothetical protein
MAAADSRARPLAFRIREGGGGGGFLTLSPDDLFDARADRSRFHYDIRFTGISRPVSPAALLYFTRVLDRSSFFVSLRSFPSRPSLLGAEKCHSGRERDQSDLVPRFGRLFVYRPSRSSRHDAS